MARFRPNGLIVLLVILGLDPITAAAQSFVPPDWILLAHYPLTVNGIDTTGNYEPMILTNVAFTNEGTVFNGRYIGNDPTGSDAQTPAIPDLDLEAFAVTARFKAQEAFDGPVFIVGDSWRSSGVWLEPDSSLHSYSNGSRDPITDAIYEPGVFYEVGILHDGERDTLTVYLDGSPVVKTGREIDTRDDRNVTVTDGGGARSFYGVLTDLRVYSRDQTATATGPADVPERAPNRVEVYPNPVTGSSRLVFESEVRQSATIQIRDVLGRRIGPRIGLGPTGGGPAAHPLPSNLTPGLYIATVTQDDVVSSTTFVVTRARFDP